MSVFRVLGCRDGQHLGVIGYGADETALRITDVTGCRPEHIGVLVVLGVTGRTGFQIAVVAVFAGEINIGDNHESAIQLAHFVHTGSGDSRCLRDEVIQVLEVNQIILEQADVRFADEAIGAG